MKQKILALTIATANTEAEEAMKKMLHSLHRFLPNHEQLILEFASVRQFLTFYIVVDDKNAFLVKSQLLAQFPDIEITETKDYLPTNDENLFVAQIDFRHASSSSFKTYTHLQESFLTSLFAVLAKIDHNDKFYFQLALQKTGSKIYERGIKGARYSLLSKNVEKMSKELYLGKLRIAYESENKHVAKAKLVTILNVLKNIKGENELKRKQSFIPQNISQQFLTRQTEPGDFWTCEELATLFHFPTNKNAFAHVVHTNAKRAPAPDFLPRDDIAHLAETNYQNERIPFGIHDEDRRRHLYVIGKTGVGKSRFLELLMLSDIKNKKGFCLIDPHGDLAESILQQIPQDRIDDVIYVDPANRDFPIAFNPLEYTQNYEKRQHIAFFFIAIFKKIFAADWNERMEHLLRYIILAILETPDATILGIPRILSDVMYRHRVISQIQDPVVKQFWANEFSSWNEQYASTTIVPILNKVGQFVANPIIRNMVGQQQNALNFENFMNTGKIVIINVSKGKLGEENATLLGSMFITKIQQAALARARIKEEDRQDFYFYIDEFQNFATDAFKSILSESRKYRLNLTIAHQYMGQLTDDIKASVFGNVASFFVFAVGGDDAAYLANEFAPTFNKEDILSLETREMYIKMSIQGRVAKPFSARTLTTPEPQWNYKQEIVTHTQSKYGTNRISVEHAIEQWLQNAQISQDEEVNQFPEPLT